MKTEDKKVIIPIIRKIYPKMIASDLVKVQPMHSNIFNLETKYAAEKWRKKFLLWPQKSINGKTVFGLINERGVWKDVKEALSGQGYKTHTERVIEYATNKELFELKLKGED